jgi:hypothetical protein
MGPTGHDAKVASRVFMISHYGKQVLRREQKALARVFPWALGEELFTELGEDKNSR